MFYEMVKKLYISGVLTEYIFVFTNPISKLCDHAFKPCASSETEAAHHTLCPPTKPELLSKYEIV